MHPERLGVCPSGVTKILTLTFWQLWIRAQSAAAPILWAVWLSLSRQATSTLMTFSDKNIKKRIVQSQILHCILILLVRDPSPRIRRHTKGQPWTLARTALYTMRLRLRLRPRPQHQPLARQARTVSAAAAASLFLALIQPWRVHLKTVVEEWLHLSYSNELFNYSSHSGAQENRSAPVIKYKDCYMNIPIPWATI